MKMANALKKAGTDKQPSPTSSEEKKTNKLLADLVKKGRTSSIMGELSFTTYVLC